MPRRLQSLNIYSVRTGVRGFKDTWVFVTKYCFHSRVALHNFSMHFSLELRSPYLDHNLFEFVFSLPKALKQSGGAAKALLFKSLPNPLPAEITRQPKRGFTFPISVWLRQGLKPTFEEVMTDSVAADLWDSRIASKIFLESTWLIKGSPDDPIYTR